MSWVFVYFQCDYIFSSGFESLTDKAMQIMIGFGVTGIVLVYAILDGVRFLPSICDKVLYVVSCCLLKPVLLPTILPGYCFNSAIAVKRHSYVHKFEGLTETRFMVACEECNFLLTFTLAGVSAMSTFIAVCQTTHWAELPFDTMLVSLSYGLFGLTVAILMYGRKVERSL